MADADPASETGSSFCAGWRFHDCTGISQLDALLAQNKTPAVQMVATDERWVTDADAQSNEVYSAVVLNKA
jgi:hypothetical protein